MEPDSGARSELMHNLKFVTNDANYYFSVIYLTDWRVLLMAIFNTIIGIYLSVRSQGQSPT